MDKPETAVERFINAMGGTANAAAALGIHKANVVANWRLRGQVPPDKVLAVESLTGISRHELRPDIFGKSEASA